MGMHKALASRYSDLLVTLEEKLISEYNSIIQQEETFWFKKSQVRWFQDGDPNTRFFHLFTICGRR